MTKMQLWVQKRMHFLEKQRYNNWKEGMASEKQLQCGIVWGC